MKAIEYVTNLPVNGTITVPPEMLTQLNLKGTAMVRILILYEEEPKINNLAQFAGQWQDERSADTIVNEIYAERENNQNGDTIAW